MKKIWFWFISLILIQSVARGDYWTITLYIRDQCPACEEAAGKLVAAGIEYSAKNIREPYNMQELSEKMEGETYVPALVFKMELGGMKYYNWFMGDECADKFLNSEAVGLIQQYNSTEQKEPAIPSQPVVEDTLQAQDTSSKNYDSFPADSLPGFSLEEIKLANTGISADYMNPAEKNVLLLLNLARMDGLRFFQYIMPLYIEMNNKSYKPIQPASNLFYLSLRHDMESVKNLPLLYPEKEFYLAAEFHALDMGKTGNIGHLSSDGKKPMERIERFTQKKSNIAENCYYGSDQPILIVGSMLHDDGQVGVAHRRNILNSRYTKAGIAIREHKVFKFNCVQDFSD